MRRRLTMRISSRPRIDADPPSVDDAADTSGTRTTRDSAGGATLGSVVGDGARPVDVRSEAATPNRPRPHTSLSLLARRSESLDRVRERLIRDSESASKIDKRLQELREIPKSTPPVGPPGTLTVRLVGVPRGQEVPVPLVGVEVHMRQGDGEPVKAGTDPLGVVSFVLPPVQEAALVLSVVDSLGEIIPLSLPSGLSTAAASQPALVLGVGWRESLEPAFKLGLRFHAGLAAAEKEAERIKKELAEERAMDLAAVEAELGEVNTLIDRVGETRGGR